MCIIFSKVDKVGNVTSIGLHDEDINIFLEFNKVIALLIPEMNKVQKVK